MYYYKTESDSQKEEEPLGEIILNDIMSVTQLKEKDKLDRFDVQVPSRIFALKCDNPTELKKWVAALQQMSHMNDYQKPSILPDSPAETMKMLASGGAGSGSGGAASTPKALDATAAIELISKGSAFLKYDYDPATDQTQRDIVTVFYQKDATALGSLYYCEPGEKVASVSAALSLHTLTDMYLGKQSKAFRSTIARNAAGDKCFTAVGASHGKVTEFNLEGDSKEQVSAWLFAINAILTKTGGRKVMSAEDSAREEAARREAKARAVAEAERKAVEVAAATAAATAAAAAAATANRAPMPEETVVSFVGFDSDDEDAAEPMIASSTPPLPSPTSSSQASAAATAAAPATESVAAPVEEEEVPAILPVAPAAPVPVAPAPVAEVPAAAEPVPESAPAPMAPVIDAVASVSLNDTTPLASPSSAAAAAAASSPPAPFVIDGNETIITWLASLGDAYVSEYSKLFQSNGVDLQFLAGLTVDDLSELGIKNGLHLKKMGVGIEKLKEHDKYAPQVRKPVVAVAAPAPVSEIASPVAPVAPTPTHAAEAAPVASEESAPPASVDPETLSEVGKFLHKLGPAFLTYLKAFELNGVDMNFLQTLQDDDLEELGVTKLHRKKILTELKELRSKSAPRAPASTVKSSSTSSAASASSSSSGASALSPASASSGKMDAILASIREAKQKRAETGGSGGGHSSQPSTDGIDLGGMSIAQIAARMAAQREARNAALAAQQQQQQQQ